jgi:hypothetical protein
MLPSYRSTYSAIFSHIGSVAKDVDASEETFLALCLLSLWRIRVVAAESAMGEAAGSDGALA